jgi:rare lipoprotein A
MLLLLAGCLRFGPPPASLHYVLGAPYQAGGVWYYPRESFDFDETGLAMVVQGQGATTVDGEVYDPNALAASHPTLQLPALARVTNLENGRQVLVRINDRGLGTPTRLIGLTPRTAELLAAADPTAIRVRVQVLEAESRQMADELRPEGPHLAVATQPALGVQSENLASPAGISSAPVAKIAAPITQPVVASAPPAAVPLRLPEAVTQGPAHPGRLLIDCGGFASPEPADLLRARLAALGAYATTDYYAPRDRAYMVRIGPLASVAAADAMLRRALAAGATDARIIVE